MIYKDRYLNNCIIVETDLDRSKSLLPLLITEVACSGIEGTDGEG